MAPELLGSFLRPFHHISDETLAYFAKQFVKVKYPAKHIFQREGDVCTKVAIIEKGLVRNYFNVKNKEFTSWFDTEGSFVGSLYSFFTQIPYSENIEFLENTVVYETTFEKIEATKAKFEDFSMLIEKFVLNAYLSLDERMKTHIAYDAVERYDLFFKAHPSLINRIPVKYLASFLGVTPETLSRIRAKSYK